VRDGRLTCGACGREYDVMNGVVHMLDPADETLTREVGGWIELAGPLGEHLVPTMTALPYYPHDPWPATAPDFFQIFEHVRLAGARVVDVGAGRTWSSRYLATIGRAREVVAVDVLTTRFLGLETADVYLAEDGVLFERVRADVHQIPLPDGWADAVVSVASIHHSGDLPRLFGEVWRILRPGGAFVFVSEPCKKASIPDRQPRNAETAHGINEHIYSFAEYAGALAKAGFRSRHIVPRSVAYRLLYPDDEFMSGLPALVRRLTDSEAGRAAFMRLLGSRLTGRLIYRWANLPLSVVAWKPGS